MDETADARFYYDQAIAAQRRMEQLEQALRALILEPPWRDSRGSADVWCGWCDAITYGGAPAEHFHDLTLHDEECPWRTARALLGLDGRALD
jgi:hypothetical protein